ncbi:helix-turn-helix transcriptional regulator [Leptolyngbya cf. ectocarpi LEGE 11479]|uniref:Helix-turn-helix transcriptional regulator n=1 Tax=Leptolyngbya cf. ectocarpi LEGE 11479 TaxID=1828722 RepID=A0A928ZUE3_LEPEC|nr:AraC family transcriptional regulator [Leptolyngbya ectocarpi]MBE9067646.1 helix-turn-helix transcriptional regulator [Leptolyngbya cf. ectocarpi LEGE 11479]
MALAQSQPADSFPEDSQSSGSALETETIQIEQLRFPPGEADFQAEAAHTLFVNLTSRPQSYLQKQDGKTHTGLYRRGDMLITPANTPLFVRWEGAENCLQIQLPAAFLKRVAEETLGKNGDRLTLVPTFQSRQQQLESISTLLLAEVQQRQPNGLYLDSLANVLAVQLLRNYGTTSAQVPTYEGGLPTYQLNQVLDYIDAGLAGEIKLANLAGLLNMSPFHFGRMFKQSMGISPHQYVIQQRLERAKHLLRQSDQAIIDIALECGFNSHSHLSKQFRKVMGVAPSSFRD